MKEKILKIFLYLSIFLPPLVIAKGLLFPFVSGKAYLFRFFVEISLFLWLLLILENKKYLPNFKNPLVLSLLAFALGLTFTGFLGVDPIHSFFSEIERADGIIQYLHWVLYFLMIVSVFKERKDWQIFGTIFVVLGILISLFGWGQYLSDHKLFFYGEKRSRIEGTFGNPDYMPVFLIFAMTFLTWLYLEFRKKEKFEFKEKEIGFLVLFLFFLLTFVFTQTRGAYFGFGCGFLLFVGLFNIFYFKKQKKIALSLLILIFLGIISWSVLFYFKDTDFVKSNPILRRAVVDISFKHGSLAQRLRTWNVALNVFKEKPIFGWGPENFFAGFNKYLDPRIPRAGEPWFDKVHNQYLQILCEGGIFLFILYLIFIFAVFYQFYKLIKNKEKRFLGIVLLSFYFAYLSQAIFLFDTFPMYLGLFPFLGLLYFETDSFLKKDTKLKKEIFCLPNYLSLPAKILIFLLTTFLLIECVWLPYKSNRYLRLYIGAYSQALNPKKNTHLDPKKLLTLATNYFDEALKINSPFTLTDVQKRGGWTIISHINQIEKLKDSKEFEILSQKVIEELEKANHKHPYDPQIYFILGKIYFFEAFDLKKKEFFEKAERILKKGLEFSPRRPSYLVGLAQVYISQDKYQEAGKVLDRYTKEVEPSRWGLHRVLGEIFYALRQYKKAEKKYLEAIDAGWQFWKNRLDFEKMILAFAKTNNWNQVVSCYKKYLEFHPKDALGWYNYAVGLQQIGRLKEAQEALNHALELNPKLKIKNQ